MTLVVHYSVQYQCLCHRACYDMGRTVCIDRLKVQRREKEKDLRYIQALAPAAVTVYQIYNMSLAHIHL
jgi:hypothetical protein